MRISTICILAVWTLTIFNTICQSLTYDPHFRRVLVAFNHSIFCLFPIPFFVIGAFFMPRPPLYHPRLAEFVNRRYGQGAYEMFLARLKPILLFGISALLGTAAEFWYCSQNNIPYEQGVNFFFLAGGIGFVLAHIILRLRKMPGV